MCNCVGVLLSGRFVDSTADGLVRFHLFVRWNFLFSSTRVVVAQNFSGRFVLQCSQFGFVLCCTRVFVRSWARVLFRSVFVSPLVYSVVILVMLALVCSPNRASLCRGSSVAKRETG